MLFAKITVAATFFIMTFAQGPYDSASGLAVLLRDEDSLSLWEAAVLDKKRCTIAHIEGSTVQKLLHIANAASRNPLQ